MLKKPLVMNRCVVRTQKNKTAWELTKKGMPPTNAMHPANANLLDIRYNNTTHKQPCQETNICCICQGDSYDVEWSSCKCHNFCHLDYRKPSGTMHSLIMNVVTNIDKNIVALVPEVVPMIDMIVRIKTINLSLVFGRSKTIMLMIMNVCNLALVLVPVPQAILAIFTVTLMMGIQPIFIPKNVAELNGPIHKNNNKNMINQIIRNPMQPN